MPATTTIVVTTADIRATAAQYRAAAANVRGLLGSLDANASNLTQGWTGRSLASFDNLWSRWRKEMYDLAQAMDTIAATLERSAVNYVQTDANAMPTTHGPR